MVQKVLHQTIRLAMKGGNSSDLPKKEGNSIFEVKSQFLQNQLIQ